MSSGVTRWASSLVVETIEEETTDTRRPVPTEDTGKRIAEDLRKEDGLLEGQGGRIIILAGPLKRQELFSCKLSFRSFFHHCRQLSFPSAKPRIYSRLAFSLTRFNQAAVLSCDSIEVTRNTK